jgi:hypothetical protein
VAFVERETAAPVAGLYAFKFKIYNDSAAKKVTWQYYVVCQTVVESLFESVSSELLFALQDDFVDGKVLKKQKFLPVLFL